MATLIARQPSTPDNYSLGTLKRFLGYRRHVNVNLEEYSFHPERTGVDPKAL
jgi:hypothetical protein